MMRAGFFVAILSSSIPLASQLHAQVTLDVAKITCEQFVLYKITNPRNIAMWISGYYNGKIDNTVLDTDVLERNADKLTDYCLRNPKTPVMQAAAAALNPKQ